MAIRGRRNRRFVFEDATVEYRKHSSLPFLGGSPKVSPIINFSIGGLQFVAEDYFDPGQRLDLKVMIPSAFRSMTVRCEVVWTRRVAGRDCYRTGARYLEPSPADVGLLRSLEEQYWAIPDERKQQLEALVQERYPLQGADAPAERAGQPEPEPAPASRAQQAPEAASPEKQEPPAREEAPPPVAAATEEQGGEAAEAPEAAPQEPRRIPLYDLIAGIESKKDESGFVLQGMPKSHLVLPDITDPDCFALEIHDDSMHQAGPPSFERGDIVLFSPNRPARTGDLAFVITRDGGVFRQVFFDANSVLRLRPLNGWHAEQSFAQGEVKGLWKLIGKYKKFTSE